MRSLSWDSTRAAFRAASSTRRSFSPFFGTTSLTFIPRLAVSHSSMTPSSSTGYWSQTSRGIKGVPA